jgi:hypothetical protein
LLDGAVSWDAFLYTRIARKRQMRRTRVGTMNGSIDSKGGRTVESCAREEVQEEVEDEDVSVCWGLVFEEMMNYVLSVFFFKETEVQNGTMY